MLKRTHTIPYNLFITVISIVFIMSITSANTDICTTLVDTYDDSVDNCPDVNNPSQSDSDADRYGDLCDDCPNDPAKVKVGQCGCGNAETDSDSDGTADCIDGCPNDSAKTASGICGCGVSDVDTDKDGTPDCNDQ